MIKTTSDRSTTVDTNYHWREVGPDTPRGTKLQLINRRLGVAIYGHYSDGSAYTHWCPLPTFKKDAHEQ